MSETFTEKRGPGRPPNVERPTLRPEARPSLRDRLRGKTREFMTNQNRHEVPQSVLDRYPDVSFEMKAQSVLGEERPHHISYCRQQGFEPIYADEVPEMAVGVDGPVIIDGLQLMGRPKELEIKAREEVKRLADQQIANQNRKNGVSRLTPQEFGNYKGNPGGIQEQAMRPIPVEE